MRIRVIAPDEEDGKTFRLNIPIPLGIMKWSMVWRFMPKEYKIYETMAKELVGALEDYKRKNGSWDLVDVSTKDGTKVLIRI